MASYRKNLLHCILKTGISTWRTYNGKQKNVALKDFMYPSRVVDVTVEDVNEDRVNSEVDTDANGLNADINTGNEQNPTVDENEGNENTGSEGGNEGSSNETNTEETQSEETQIEDPVVIDPDEEQKIVEGDEPKGE